MGDQANYQQMAAILRSRLVQSIRASTRTFGSHGHEAGAVKYIPDTTGETSGNLKPILFALVIGLGVTTPLVMWSDAQGPDRGSDDGIGYPHPCTDEWRAATEKMLKFQKANAITEFINERERSH